jgi:fibronectin-binding autotransporter adhesin
MSVTRSARKNRLSGKSTRHQAIAAISAATSLVAWAAVSKADTYGFNDTSTALNTVSPTPWTDETTSSVGTAAPGSGDTAQFDSLAGLTSTTTLTLGQNTTWGGLTVLNPGAAIVIGNTTGDNSNTLTLGSTNLAGGINMSAATQNLTIVDPVSIDAIGQSFLVNAGQSLTLNGPIGLSSATASATLTFGGGGTQNVNGVISDASLGGAIAESGTGTVVLTAANNFTGSTQLNNGVMELNFNAGATSTNILPSAAELRLGGGTLLINGSASSVSSQTFASTEAGGATFVTPGLSTVQVMDNSGGAHLPTVTLGTITADNISTNLGGLINFIGPTTSTDGYNGTGGGSVVPATGTINVGSTATFTGGLLVDANDGALGVVGQANGQVTDYAAINPANPSIVVGGSTITGFYTEDTTNAGLGSGGNIDLSGAGEMRISSSQTFTTLRFNTPTAGLYNGFGNNIDQFIVKNASKVLITGGVLITSNVGANNVLLTQDQNNGSGGTTTALDYQNLEPSGAGAEDFNIFQYDTQGVLILNTGFHDPHGLGYAQSGPGAVELNAFSQTGTTSGMFLAANLNGGLTILGNYAQGGALASAASVNLNGGNLDVDYTGTMDDGFARPITVNPAGGGVSATSGHVLTVDGVISGAGTLNIGYSGIATNEAVSDNNNTIIQNLPSSPNTLGNGTVILTAANTYSGGTNVNYGTVQIDTGTAGTGPIAVGTHGILAGTANLTNTTTVTSGGQLTPGDPISAGPTVGTLGLGSLSLNSGSFSNFAFASDTSFSTVNVTGNLTIANGAQFNIDQSGNASNPFTDSGTYDIFNVTGSISLGTPVFGSNAATYSLTKSGDEVLLVIAGSTPETWNTAGGGTWATANDWYPMGVPNSVGAEADFLSDVGNTMTPALGGTVDLDGNETVGTIVFNNSNSFTIAAGSAVPSSVLHIQAKGSGSGIITDSAGSNTFSAPVSLDSTNNSVSVINSSSTLTFGNIVEGIGGLSINPSGAGTVVLTTNNNYDGPTSIGGGTLQVGTGGANGSLGGSNTPVANNGTLILDVTTGQSLGITGSGTFTQKGSETTVLNGANTAGAFNLNAGEVQLATSASLSTTGDLTMASGTTLDLNGGNATLGGLSEATGTATINNSGGGTPTLSFGSDGNSNTFSGQILNATGTVSLVKAGNGTETLSAINSYTGGTTINAGALLVTNASGSGVGSGTITVAAANGLQLGNGVTLSNPITDGAGTVEFEDVPSGSATLSGAIAVEGGGQFRVGTISPTATLTLTGASTGGTSSIFIITRGNIVVDGSGASITSSHTSSALLIGRQSNTSTLNLTVENGGQINSAEGVDLASGTAASDDESIVMTVQSASSINAGGAFNLNDDLSTGQQAPAGYSYPVNLTLTGGSSLTTTAFQSTSTANTSTGFAISGGSSIIASASDTLAGTGATQTGAIFMPETTNADLGTASVFTSIGSGGAIINNNGFSITIGESLGDGGAGSADTVTFSGTGTTVIANSNTYGGNTTITAGTVIIANGSGSATSTGTITVSGGTLASASPSRITLLQGGGTVQTGTPPVGVAFGANLDNSGAGVISGPVVVGAAGTVAPGEVGAGNFGTMSLNGLTTVASSTIDFDLNTGTGSAPTSATGDYLILNGAFSSLSIGSGTDLTFDSTGTIGDYYRIIGGAAISGHTAALAADFVLPAGYTLNTTIDPGFIDVLVSSPGPANLTWNDFSTNNLWDNGSSTNWNNGSSNTTFSAGSTVTFNDSNGSASGRYAVTLNTLVSPGSVTVNNTTGNYTISGTGTIGGTGALTKMGTGTLTLSTPNTYNGGTTVSAGKLLIAQAGTNATIVNSTTLTIGNTLTALPSGGALSISGSGIVQLADGVTNQTFVTPNSHSPVVTSNINLKSLSITGDGTLDIGNNRIIVDYTSGNDPIASIAAWIKAGYNDGDTPGAGPSIISSDIATDDTASGYSYGIGYADGADGVVAGLPSGEIEIMFTLLGDANLDGTVNGDDFSQFSSNLGGSPRAWDEGDFNYDGTVNGEDFAPFSHNQGQTDSLAASETGTLTGPLELSNGISSNLSLTNVPEPASMGLLTVGLVSVLARRRRRPKA